MNKTLGELRIRTDFNVSDNSDVSKLKELTASLINITNSLEPHSSLEGTSLSEFNRLKSIALTHYETAAMFAVKAATTTN